MFLAPWTTISTSVASVAATFAIVATIASRKRLDRATDDRSSLVVEARLLRSTTSALAAIEVVLSIKTKVYRSLNMGVLQGVEPG